MERSLSGTLMRLLFRPGWRLRCVDPPIAWLQLRDEQPPVVAIRLQLTCYLTSRIAQAVWLKDAQLRLHLGEQVFIVPLVAATKIDGDPFGRDSGFDVSHDEPHHALVDFATDAPTIVALLSSPGSPVAVDLEALLNDGIEYRRIADLELGRADVPEALDDWIPVDTGRARDQ